MGTYYNPLFGNRKRGFCSGTIYEGLRDIDIQRAMDEEFGRVENMMFIRTIKTDETGKTARDPETGVAVTSDDGC